MTWLLLLAAVPFFALAVYTQRRSRDFTIRREALRSAQLTHRDFAKEDQLLESAERFRVFLAGEPRRRLGPHAGRVPK